VSDPNPLVEELRDLEPFSPEWREARDRLHAEDPGAYRRWLDDEYNTDEILRGIERESEES
jgi:hypothetical protein